MLIFDIVWRLSLSITPSSWYSSLKDLAVLLSNFIPTSQLTFPLMPKKVECEVLRPSAVFVCLFHHACYTHLVDTQPCLMNGPKGNLNLKELLSWSSIFHLSFVHMTIHFNHGKPAKLQQYKLCLQCTVHVLAIIIWKINVDNRFFRCWKTRHRVLVQGQQNAESALPSIPLSLTPWRYSFTSDVSFMN